MIYFNDYPHAEERAQRVSRSIRPQSFATGPFGAFLRMRQSFCSSLLVLFPKPFAGLGFGARGQGRAVVPDPGKHVAEHGLGP